MATNLAGRYFTINENGNRTYISAMQFTDLRRGRDIVEWISPGAKAIFTTFLPREKRLHMILILPDSELHHVYLGVRPNDWVIKTDSGNSFVLNDEAFKLAYSEGEDA